MVLCSFHGWSDRASGAVMRIHGRLSSHSLMQATGSCSAEGRHKAKRSHTPLLLLTDMEMLPSPWVLHGNLKATACRETQLSPLITHHTIVKSRRGTVCFQTPANTDSYRSQCSGRTCAFLSNSLTTTADLCEIS